MSFNECYVISLFVRHIIAAVHFNSNLQREVKCKEADGAEMVKISYPKFKNGEATVRNVRVKQNFGEKQHCVDVSIEFQF